MQRRKKMTCTASIPSQVGSKGTTKSYYVDHNSYLYMYSPCLVLPCPLGRIYWTRSLQAFHVISFYQGDMADETHTFPRSHSIIYVAVLQCLVYMAYDYYRVVSV